MLDAPPLAQIDIYSDCVILTRRDPTGAWRSFPITPEALAQALGKLPTTTGLLPAGMIGNGLKDGQPFYVQYIAPRAVGLQILEGQVDRVVRIQTPPLIWAAWKSDYRIWAVQDTKTIALDTPLFRAPFPNTHNGNGGICWGSARPAAAAAGTLAKAFKLFLEESLFNDHLAGDKSKQFPANVLRRYDDLDEKAPYPVADLMPAGLALRAVLQGSCWR